MSYDSQEISVESGEPVELYTFTIGADVYEYTSAEDSVTVDGTTYPPKPLTRDSQKDGKRNQDTPFQVTTPSTNPVALLFVNTVPGKRLKLVVKRYHRGDTPTPTLREVFNGYVESVDFKKDCFEAVFNAKPALSALNREMPRYGYQSQCGNVLFDSQCGISDSDPLFKLTGAPVASAVGRVLTVGGAALFDDGWFTGGFAEVDGGLDHRLVVSHTGDQIELSHPFIPTPTIVSLFAGCAHTIQVCNSKFGNISGGATGGFQGCAFVPTRNPFQTGL